MITLTSLSILVCKISLLTRALGLKAAAAIRPSARATIGYLVYNVHPQIFVYMIKTFYFTGFQFLMNGINLNTESVSNKFYVNGS